MAQYVVLAMEGVLARSSEPLSSAQPIPAGITLYNALKNQWKLILLTLEQQVGLGDRWCKLNGVEHFTTIVHGAHDKSLVLRNLRGNGYPIELYVDASPASVATAMHLGITGICFASPVYARPEFRPDAPRGIREWEQIEAELEVQRILKSDEPVRTADLHD